MYLKFFGFGVDDFIPCELCGQRANDVHHIDARGMGGDPTGKKDVIENLMGLCRKHHDLYGDIVSFMPILTRKHKEYMKFKTEQNENSRIGRHSRPQNLETDS